jgi:hypothetical protein
MRASHCSTLDPSTSTTVRSLPDPSKGNHVKHTKKHWAVHSTAAVLLAGAFGLGLTGCSDDNRTAPGVPDGAHITGGNLGTTQTHGWSVSGGN